MKEKWNFIIYLVWFSYLTLSAVLMFGQGFLLSRKTLSDVSECLPLSNFECDDGENSSIKATCTDERKIQTILTNSGSPILCAPKRSRIVLILVDALRYDFTEFNEDFEKPLFYQNKIPVIKNNLKQWPERTRLFRFMADPPTTTLQRIKALVTGSLPTFIDMSSNFAAMEIQEDNVIDQLVKGGGKAILLGDDTWARLLPGRWLRSHAIYSFHTWDLDTADNEVDSKIYDEIKKNDWDLLVAHYLGVDHAGHRYGPNHPEMARKLRETNSRIEKIIELLPSDAILYVVGDHGMTETDSQEWKDSDGDHGGESKNERTAALFAYHKLGFAGDSSGSMTGNEVQQTDLAPTMSAAFGRPPPAPSLGNILFPILPKMEVTHTVLHLSNNLKQVKQYLIRYGEESQQVALDKLTHLINATRDLIDNAANIQNDEQLKIYINNVGILMDNIRSIFREVWVEFDSLSMLRALLLLVLTVFFNWLITEGIPTERIPHVFASTFVPSGIIAMAVCIGICYTGHHFEILYDVAHAIILSTGLVSGIITSILVIMHWDGITQRWHEGRTQFYERFSRAALFGSALVLVSNSYIIEEGATLSFLALTILGLMAWNISSLKSLMLWAGFGSVMALTRSYRGCREEQGDCWTSMENTGNASRAALVIALGSVAAVVAISRRHIEWRGYGIVIAGIFTCAHWAVGWGSLGSPSRSKMLGRGAWLVIVAMFLLLWRRDGRGATLPLVVCSLLLYLANALVLGAAFAPTAGLALISGFLALNLVSMLKTDGSSKFSLSTRCSSSMACLWALLGSYHFYGTGHHATLSNVRWAAVFHAGDPNYTPFGTIISFVLMFIYLFGMPLMFGATVPLLALWGRNGASPLGPRTQMAAVFSLCLKFSLCFAIRVFACALSATIHCRHLMIWGVFTPKLLFEVGSCTAALLGTIIGATLTAWHLPNQTRSS